MTDTRIETWIAERKRILAAATEGPWEAYEGPGREPANILTPQHTPIPMINGCCDGDGYLDNPADVVSIADAHNHLPAFIRGWEAVLDRHRPIEVEPSNTICGGCSHRLPNGRYMPVVEYPCETVRAIEAVIGDD